MTPIKAAAGEVSREALMVERHPGPFTGPDAELARACAMATIPDYGNDDPDTHQRIMRDGIWNDHIAVQTALTAIHSIRKTATLPQAREAGEPPLAKLLKEVDPGLADILTDNAAYVRLIRSNVIDECAKVCDRWIRSKNLHERLAADDIARDIRALKTQDTGSEK